MADKPDGTNLRPANTEGGLLLQSERQTTFCVQRHDHSLERKHARTYPKGVNSSVSNVDFFRLTLAAPAYSLRTAIHSERKSRVFLICSLVFGKSSSPQIVCGAANLQSGVECIHNLQNAVHYQIPRRFSLIKRA